MRPSTASKTALSTSLMRALHTRADTYPIINDPWGDRLVPESAREGVRQRALSAAATSEDSIAEASSDAIIDAWLRASPAYATVVTRSRYAEDALHLAVARGVRQYVLIGAGFDSYALRTPMEARHIDIYDVDHPATQTFKRQRIEECGLSLRNSVYFVAADLSTESLASVLAKSPFDSTKPAFFSWLGVTMYLSREANLVSLLAIAQSSAPGSELVFTYLDTEAFRAEPDSAPKALSVIRRSVASIGEPFLSAFDPRTLADDLRGVGFELEEDLDDFQLVDRYDPRGLNGLKAAKLSHIAHARMTGISEHGAA